MLAIDVITDEKKVNSRIRSGEIIKQKSWQMIRELNSFSNEQLDKVALIGSERSYTYRQMFRWWERYAEVFSALGITEKRKARVGIIAGPHPKTVIAFYALNMMGVSVTMLDQLFWKDKDNCRQTIEKEGITDIIITDECFNDMRLKSVLPLKREMGIDHIIADFPACRGPLSTAAMRRESEDNIRDMRNVRGILFMDELLDRYEAYPIAYGSGAEDDAAVILHSSGTTRGVQKPIPFSDRALNEAVVRFFEVASFSSLRGRAVIWLVMTPTSGYSFVDMMHLPLAFGGSIVTIPRSLNNPLALKTISYYHVNMFFMIPGFPEMIMRLPFRPDLSSIEFTVTGGGFISADSKKRNEDFLRECGSEAKLAVGYGLSEAGGACFVHDGENENASFGYPLPGIKAKIYSEEDERFYDIEDGQHTGVLYLSSESLSSGRIDDTVFFELEEIDGEKYLNTYDVVRINEDGSASFVGRANRFFVNNDGVRFDAGLVETAVASQPGILACGLVPAYSKIIHDTVPVLYAETEGAEDEKKKILREALKTVFIGENSFEKTNLPSQCVISDKLPRNSSGKVDVYRIREKGAPGQHLVIEPVRKDGRLTDIKLRPLSDNGPVVGFEAAKKSFAIPEELENRPRYENMYKRKRR